MRDMITLSDTLGCRTYKYHQNIVTGEQTFRESFRGLRIKNNPEITKITGEVIVD